MLAPEPDGTGHSCPFSLQLGQTAMPELLVSHRIWGTPSQDSHPSWGNSSSPAPVVDDAT